MSTFIAATSVHQLARFLGRLRREHRPGDEEARAIERRRLLAVARRELGAWSPPRLKTVVTP